jgi:hypothetical protein
MNVVFSYVGTHPALLGCVLRVRKMAVSVAPGTSSSAHGTPPPSLFPAAPVVFANSVIRPLLGDFVVDARPVPVPPSFLTALQRQLEACPGRPASRRGLVDMSVPYVVLMPDVAQPPRRPRPALAPPASPPRAACPDCPGCCGGSRPCSRSCAAADCVRGSHGSSGDPCCTAGTGPGAHGSVAAASPVAATSVHAPHVHGGTIHSPRPPPRAKQTFGVEIKPKWGRVPQTGFPALAQGCGVDRAQPQSYMSRYCMLQVPVCTRHTVQRTWAAVCHRLLSLLLL